jgi:hypothetical protein
VDAVFAWKLSVLAFKLFAAASKAFDHKSVATFFEMDANAAEAGEALHDLQRDVVRAAAERLQAQIERNGDEWLRSEFGSDPSGQADASAAIAALADVLSKCLPDGLSVAQANLDPERIAGLVVAKAGRADEAFRERTFGGRLLGCLVRRAYEEAKRDHNFAAVIGIPVQEVLLIRTDLLVAGQAKLQDEIADLKARFAPQFEATATEYRLPREAVDRLLLTTVGKVEPAAIPTAFDEVARRFTTTRRAIVVEATESVYNVDFLDGVLKLTSTHGSDSAFARWEGARGQLHVLNPHIMTSNLASTESVKLLEDEEISVIIRLNNSMCEFAEALRNTQQASDHQFKQAFGDLYTKRSQLVDRLVSFFDKFSTSGDDMKVVIETLDKIKRPIPAFWRLVIVGEEFAPYITDN